MRDREVVRRTIKKKERSGLPLRKRFCRLCVDKVKALDYKDARRLEAFIKERGKIVSTRSSGNCAKHQRMLTEVIKRARYISLLPYARA
jgi:small subunit ribosomal protein S18